MKNETLQKYVISLATDEEEGLEIHLHTQLSLNQTYIHINSETISTLKM